MLLRSCFSCFSVLSVPSVANNGKGRKRMAEKLQVYKCVDCGNVVEVLNAGNGSFVCCGKPMEHLAAKIGGPGQGETRAGHREGSTAASR